MSEQKQKMVNFSVISNDGDTPYSMVPQDALATIRKMQEEKGKWAYLDGEYKNADTISTEDLIKAETIILTNQLGGGEQFKTESLISEKIENDIEIIFDPENEKISYKMNQEAINQTLDLKEYYSKVLWHLLEEAARELTNDVARTYGRKDIAAPLIPLSNLGFKVETSWLHKEEMDEKPEYSISINFDELDRTLFVDAVFDEVLIHYRELIAAGFRKAVDKFVAEEIQKARQLYNV
jgi:hypothetical protein